MSVTKLIADQLRRAFDGDAWHGDSLFEILQGVDARTSAAHPIAGAHSIWELVLHITTWDRVVRRRMHSDVLVEPSDAENFPQVRDTSETAWIHALAEARQAHQELIAAVLKFPEARLSETVPGKDHDFANMLLGTVQHELYHAGQITLLKKAAQSKPALQ
jgi:uncharacterized damage-inducible protein DinB